MSDISEKWTCPLCNATWTREPGKTIEQWRQSLAVLQEKHMSRCSWLPESSR